MHLRPWLPALVLAAAWGGADPTWPATTDELEEIMYQLRSFRARRFADRVTPCGNQASGPGRQTAAEWLRAAFHDMSTANRFFGTGGLDASIQYELNNSEHTGPGHRATIEAMAPFLSPRSSLADLLALGVYASVRSCGGPVVPFRAGRRDAASKGTVGVPQPQNSVLIFQQQFERLGFTNVEMIQLTACGHTLGHVHQPDFPELFPPDTEAGAAVGLDATVTAFDNRIVTDYLDGSTTNPLVVGPSSRVDKDADLKIFGSDGNQTVKAMAADRQYFQLVCKTVLQKMIDVVPSGVQLTNPLVPYAVKPVDMQLTLLQGGASLLLTGYIRIRTTGLEAGAIRGISILYRNRQGGSYCPSGPCTIQSTLMQGTGHGFDDSFAFFPVRATLPAASGISSFRVAIRRADGSTRLCDNNGQGYRLQDELFLQAPQSCLHPATGALTIVAAARNDAAADGVQARIWYLVPQAQSPVPQLKNLTLELVKTGCAGSYSLFAANHSLDGGMPDQSHLELTAGRRTDGLKRLSQVVGDVCDKFNATCR